MAASCGTSSWLLGLAGTVVFLTGLLLIYIGLVDGASRLLPGLVVTVVGYEMLLWSEETPWRRSRH